MILKGNRITRSATIVLKEHVDKVFPLFSALEESKWAPGWNPRIVFPKKKDIEEHMVFITMKNDGQQSDYTWIVTKYVKERHLIEYLVSAPERLWTISIKCRASINRRRTNAEVRYTYTGLTEKGSSLNKKAMDEMFAFDLTDWEDQINYYLEYGNRMDRPF
jgi:hypothetical protein